MSDRESIRRLKNGDIGGLETLIARYQLKAVRAAYFIVQDEPTAEDIVQDTFLHICERIRYFDEARPFEPYLMRSVINAALNVAKQCERYAPASNDCSPDGLDRLLAQAESVETQVEFSEIKRQILEAIASLPARQRAAVVQRYYLDMSEQEMAAALSAAPGTVKWLLNAARSRLRALLGGERSAK
ncbi:RNA polymerase sigma factor, sigma-70 family [Longilinea arvoryzae]|uniref:RNA polymerase sigma factor, sigma-70 family n=1 Tax=Longilinea arvoryzae TaxID=360412 RepID=A0A0S7BG76_9CHLR|nr:sigma-70 family RNA polymerase sigma factor [Longilinea arvoryzae]GAP12442.1 RNA polymerase sigma factor, sigma-70 family [Longilinea arvoryzae]